MNPVELYVCGSVYGYSPSILHPLASALRHIVMTQLIAGASKCFDNRLLRSLRCIVFSPWVQFNMREAYQKNIYIRDKYFRLARKKKLYDVSYLCASGIVLVHLFPEPRTCRQPSAIPTL